MLWASWKICHPLIAVQEIDDLVEDWTPEPLVAKSTAFEEADVEKRPVIVGLDDVSSWF